MFEDALKLVLEFEGGYANDPDDPGGATNFGITQDVYDPTHTKNVKNITKEEVEKIYHDQYWLAGKCDKIAEWNPSLSAIHFDCCVNCGTYGAATLLQDILDVKRDGIIGSVTLSKVTPDPALSKLYLSRRKKYYYAVINNHTTLHKFLSSWLSRLDKLAKYYNLTWSSKDED